MMLLFISIEPDHHSPSTRHHPPPDQQLALKTNSYPFLIFLCEHVEPVLKNADVGASSRQVVQHHDDHVEEYDECDRNLKPCVDSDVKEKCLKFVLQISNILNWADNQQTWLIIGQFARGRNWIHYVKIKVFNGILDYYNHQNGYPGSVPWVALWSSEASCCPVSSKCYSSVSDSQWGTLQGSSRHTATTREHS